ncbi:hypothetical protein NA23_07995 [Fervidobacterium islandicum]|uniref:Uncharacterized protein n=1 Tax=Fervidobacterium islandicum TaxID=2423 RepID=A0AAI8CMG7_FERIS|nr:hypothetical protein [Fervidobacterium islandicum]AMW33183.1 hypothetical protein NA23_07995 [Fervidobacterium islandicum]
MIYIKFFGDWKVYKDGNEFNSFKSKKALKLLFYLLLSSRSKVSIEELIRTFWSGYSSEYARKNLNTQLYYIRRDLGIPYKYLRNERDFVFIDHSYFQSDYNDFIKAIENADTRKVSEVYSGILLDGLEDDWIRKHRIKCQKLYEELLKMSSESRTEGYKGVSELIAKAKVLIEHQKITREKYFIPVELPKMECCKEIRVRKGDIIFDLSDKLLIILERGVKSFDDTVRGFAKRLGIDLSEINILTEEDVLNILSSFNSKTA